MSDYTQSPEPVEPKYIRHERRPSKSMIVWIDKDEATKLLACRAALRECVEALETAQGYVESSGWTRHRADEIAQIEAAIDNARKALEE
jgi:hypothetical protein